MDRKSEQQAKLTRDRSKWLHSQKFRYLIYKQHAESYKQWSLHYDRESGRAFPILYAQSGPLTLAASARNIPHT